MGNKANRENPWDKKPMVNQEYTNLLWNCLWIIVSISYRKWFIVRSAALFHINFISHHLYFRFVIYNATFSISSGFSSLSVFFLLALFPSSKYRLSALFRGSSTLLLSALSQIGFISHRLYFTPALFHVTIKSNQIAISPVLRSYLWNLNTIYLTRNLKIN